MDAMQAMLRLDELSQLVLIETDEKKLAEYAQEMASCFSYFKVWVDSFIPTLLQNNPDVVEAVAMMQDEDNLTI